jgi:anti-sigma B factor antagonist
VLHNGDLLYRKTSNQVNLVQYLQRAKVSVKFLGTHAVPSLKMCCAFREMNSQEKRSFMQINIRNKGSVTILDIEGNLVGPNTIALKNIIDDQIRVTGEDPVFMVLNMERVQMMDSSGLGVIVAAYASISHNNGRVVLLNIGGNIRSLIVMAKLVTIFDRYDTEAEAIASFL